MKNAANIGEHDDRHHTGISGSGTEFHPTWDQPGQGGPRLDASRAGDCQGRDGAATTALGESGGGGGKERARSATRRLLSDLKPR